MATTADHVTSAIPIAALADLLVAVLELPGVEAAVARRRRTGVTAVEQFVDAGTIAAALEIPVNTVRQYAREERLPHYRVGRNLRFVRDEVEQAVLEGRLAR